MPLPPLVTDIVSALQHRGEDEEACTAVPVVRLERCGPYHKVTVRQTDSVTEAAATDPADPADPAEPTEPAEPDELQVWCGDGRTPGKSWALFFHRHTVPHASTSPPTLLSSTTASRPAPRQHRLLHVYPDLAIARHQLERMRGLAAS